MNLKLIHYLIITNCRLFAKTKLRIGKNDKYSIPRIYILIPVLIYLGYEAYSGGSLTRLWILFSISIIFFVMVRIYNRCFFDPVHLFYLNTTFKNKWLNIILAEFFGVKFLAFFTFSIVGVMIGTPGLRAVSVLFCLYLIFILLDILLSTVGNRVKLVSVVYQWALIIIFSMLYGFSGVGFANDDIDLQEMHLSFQNRVEADFVEVIMVLTSVVIALYYAAYFASKRVYYHHVFINRDSFPHKMI